MKRLLLVSMMLLTLPTPAAASCLGDSDFYACRDGERDQLLHDLDREQLESDRAYERRQEQQSDEIIQQLDRLRRPR